MRIYLTGIFLFVTFVTSAQFSDDFSDGDFTSSPVWSGDAANYEVDVADKLHLLAPAVADTSYLSTPTTNIDDVQWDFYLEMDFNPSSSNYARVYLVSDNADLKSSLNGYYVMVGNTADEVSLYRQDGSSVTKILDGLDGSVNSSSVNVRVRVTRDASGNWELLRDTLGGHAFISEGTVSDNTYTTNAYFGVFAKYTSTRSELFWFDDMGDPYLDAIVPTIISVAVISASQLDVLFSEAVDLTTAQTTTNYSVDGGVGNPISAILDGSDPKLVHLAFGSTFANATNYNLTINNVQDLFGNPIVSPSIEPFFYFFPETAIANDVIITELMADPSPPVALPEIEWVEIYNRSEKYFDLAGWEISDGSTSATLGSYVLSPGEYVVVCETGDGSSLGITNYLEVTGIPGLNNLGDDIIIRDNAPATIDSIHYTDNWYHNASKKDGGWTLERKHLNSPCNDVNNWGASIDVSGGTPGIQNSIWTDVDDVMPPYILSYEIISASEFSVTFNETMDTSATLAVSFNPSITSSSWSFTDQMTLQVLPVTLEVSTLYDVTFSAGKDCWGNFMSPEIIQIGIPDSIQPQDIILNEIMFNPLTNGSDYVEIYNRSDKILDVQDIYFGNWSDSIANIKHASDVQRLILPGEYVLVTEDTNDIIHDFSVYGVGSFVQTNDLPTYANDSGTVFMLGADMETVIDYFHYDQDYHLALLSNYDGKSLERITFEGGINNPDNWHTASEYVEWGTPGYKNSQYLNTSPSGTVTIDPQLFSPDNDGYHDVLTISLMLEGNDNIVDIDIYDNQGRLIRELKDNYFAGTEALFTWDGINDDGDKAAIGTYVLLISVLDSSNNRQTFKKVCVLGGKL